MSGKLNVGEVPGLKSVASATATPAPLLRGCLLLATRKASYRRSARLSGGATPYDAGEIAASGRRRRADPRRAPVRRRSELISVHLI